MDIKEKIIAALSEAFSIDYVRLEDDDGISGFVVSDRFQGMPSLDRQGLIEAALRKKSGQLTPKDRRDILMIAGLTPAEYQTVGAQIRVHKIRELPGGAVEIRLHGGAADAEYVRGALKNQEGVTTTKPKQVSGFEGILMSFRAKGTASNPLTKADALRILDGDKYIQVMPDA